MANNFKTTIITNITDDLLIKIYNLELENNEILISKNLIDTYLNSDNSIFIITECSSKIIGFLIAKSLVDTIDVEYIFTDKKYRGLGISSSALKTLEDYAKKNNILNLMLEVRVSNISAINLYKKNNFKIISTRKKYYPDNLEDAYVLQKELNFL